MGRDNAWTKFFFLSSLLGPKPQKKRRKSKLPVYETLEVRAMLTGPPLDADGDYDGDSSGAGDNDHDSGGGGTLDGDGDYDGDTGGSGDTDGDGSMPDGDGDYDGDTRGAGDHDNDGGGGGGTLDGDGDYDGDTSGSGDTDSDDPTGGGGGPQILVSDASATEGGKMTFTITASGMNPGATISFYTEDGSARKDTDYQGVSNWFATDSSGAGSATVTVQTLDDNATGEYGEYFTLFAIGGGTSGSGTGNIIEDNESGGQPTVTIGPASAQEGSDLSFPVTVSGAAGAVDVQWVATAAGDTADYPGGSDAIYFPGNGTQTLTIPTYDDNGYNEPGSTSFSVTVSLGSSSATTTGTITEDNDGPPPPTVSIGPASGEEGTTLSFPVTVSGATGPVTANWNAGAAGDSADYGGGSGSLSFSGNGTQNVYIQTTDDGGFSGEASTSFSITATLGSSTSTATGTITEDNDPPPPTVSVSDATGMEGSALSFPVVVSGTGGATVTVSWTASAASDTADYAGGSGSFQVTGDGTYYLPISTTDDENNTGEASSTFSLTVTLGASQSTAAGTITEDNDPPPTVSVGDASAQEGTSLIFPVTVAGTGGATVTVGWTASAAGDAHDYGGGSGLLTFHGDGTQNVSIATNDDNGFGAESDTTFSMTAQLGPYSRTATGTILEDSDVPPTVQIGDASAREGEALLFPVTVSGTNGATVTINYTSTAAGDSADYAGGSGSFNVTGDGTHTLFIGTNDDQNNTGESDTTFTVTVTAGNNQSTATGTITEDDDPPPTVQIGDAEGVEGTALRFLLVVEGTGGIPRRSIGPPCRLATRLTMRVGPARSQ